MWPLQIISTYNWFKQCHSLRLISYCIIGSSILVLKFRLFFFCNGVFQGISILSHTYPYFIFIQQTHIICTTILNALSGDVSEALGHSRKNIVMPSEIAWKYLWPPGCQQYGSPLFCVIGVGDESSGIKKPIFNRHKLYRPPQVLRVLVSSSWSDWDIFWANDWIELYI